MSDFSQGRWLSALNKVLDLPPTVAPPPLTGASQAATELTTFL
jgi:hypothetical protein